ncbi:hypothetical protein OKW43_006712 [Paraburkholderia sp. WC7.3g]|uniref:hypothetical protein n=1 Tax=Paraburkholderia sp. WC7.3g TaxID=2991070 RepID=UPI003D23CA64
MATDEKENDDLFENLAGASERSAAEPPPPLTRAQELLRLGKALHDMMAIAINRYTKNCGDTTASRREGTAVFFRFAQRSLGISQGSARYYIRCYQRFGDNPEAMSVFTFSELRILLAKHVTAEHIAAMVRAKSGNATMTREAFRGA